MNAGNRLPTVDLDDYNPWARHRAAMTEEGASHISREDLAATLAAYRSGDFATLPPKEAARIRNFLRAQGIENV